MNLREMFGAFKRGAHQVDEMPHWDFGTPPAEDVVDFCIEKYKLPQAEKNKLMVAFGTTGFVAREREGRQRWLHFSTDGRRRAKPEEIGKCPHLPDDWENYVKRYGSDSKEMRAEAVDDEGRPLRTPDPFAPPVKNKAATSSLGGISTAVPPKGPAPVGAMANPAGYKQRAPTPPAPGGGQQGEKPGPGGSPWLKGATSGMPQYPGTFKGHTVTQNGQLQAKGVGWKDKATGDHRFGRVQSMQKVGWTWDGSKWLPTDQYKGPKREHVSLRAVYEK